MKKLFTILALAFFATAMPVYTGCKTAPSARNVQYATLKAVGDTADAAVSLSAHLYAQGTLTADQARQVKDFYDQKFQPAYRLAVNAAKADLSTVASPDLSSLASQLSDLLVKFQNKTP